MVKEFNSLEEIQKYYNKDTNTYVFEENEEYIEVVVFNFNLNIDANIEAFNIKALDITANDIEALHIMCDDINARDIDIMSITANDINVNDINALDIIANDIYAHDINTWNITAKDISYFSVCFARGNIKCRSIKSNYPNAKHFVLNGELEVGEEEN